MTIEVSASDGTQYVFQNDNSELPLLVSGSRNTINILSSILTGTGAGPAIRITGTGNSLYLYSATITSAGGVAIEGSTGDDVIVNVSAAITGSILLGSGNDTFQTTDNWFTGQAWGGTGNDTLFGASATSSLSFFGEDGDDGLYGGSAADTLNGGDGNDYLVGNNGADSLIGGAGVDSLNGGLGNDFLNGGGNEGDVAIFDNYLADTTVNLINGAGTLIDNGGSFSDLGTDTLTGIHIVRFRDQQVDFRIARNELVLDQAGQSFTNSTNRYGLFATDIVADGVTLINNGEIRGTGVEHSVDVGGGGLGNGEAFALRVKADNVTIQNGANGSIIGFAEAIGIHYQNGEPITGSNLAIENAGIIRSLEGAAIGAIANNATVTNLVGATIEAATYAIVSPNGSASVTNSGTIISHGAQGSYAVRAGTLHLQNSGIITGGFDTMFYLSNITNTGAITGNSRAYGGLTLNNLAGSIAGDLTIDVTAVAGQGRESYVFTTFDNQAVFTGTLRITGTATSYVTVPPAGTVYTSSITNSGTFTGDIISSPILGTGPGGVALSFSFREVIINTGTIAGSIWMGDGDDTFTNSGSVSGTAYGGAGNDYLIGGSGVDRVDGGLGNDTLDGGTGADTLSGGAGNDTFVVDNTGDVVTEAANEGTDTVQTGIGTGASIATVYYLPDNVENLVMTNSAGGQVVAGNALSNLITGTGANDVMVLGDTISPYTSTSMGNDTVNAGGGNDFLFFNRTFDANDVVDGGAGYDTVGLLGPVYTNLVLSATSLTNVEQFSMYSSGDAANPNSYKLTTNDANVAAGQQLLVTAMSLQANETLNFNGSAETNGRFLIFGGRGADTIVGGAGNDRIIAGAGADVLTGGAGNDVFQFNAKTDSTPSARDTITDFVTGDRIDLWFLDANDNLAGSQHFAFIGSAAFSAAGQLRAVQQSPGNWLVEGDTNGDGVADFSLAVSVTDGHALAAGDFLL